MLNDWGWDGWTVAFCAGEYVLAQNEESPDS